MNSYQSSLAEDTTALEFTPSTTGSANTEWLEQIRSKDFNAALLKLDSLLNTNNSSILEKLWWIRCQLNLNLLPVSTLTSPLEEIFPSVLENSDCAGLAITTFFKAGKSLLEKNQSRLSLLMLERASAINQKHSLLTGEAKGELHLAHLNALESEIKNAQNKKENIGYISELERKLLAINKDSKNKKPEWTISGNTEEIISKNEAKKSKLSLKLVAILALLLSSGYFVFTSNNQASNDLLALSIPFADLKPINPTLVFANKQSVLSGVELRIASLGKEQSSSTNSSEASGDVDSNAIEEANKIDLPQPDQEEELESISGTIKGEEQIPETKVPQTKIIPPKIPQAKIPPLDPKNVGASTVDTVEQSPRRAGINPTLPEILNNEPRIPEGKTLEGKVLQSYDVEQFDPPLTYSTIAATEVLSAPSLLSKSLARLEIGTHIYVTKKMGFWLEIRSTGGRIGYIYAQDAQTR